MLTPPAMLSTASPALRLLLTVWREVARGLDLPGTVPAVTPRVAAILPIHRLVVRALDRERARIETLAAAQYDVDTPIAPRASVDRGDVPALAAWLREGRATAWRAGEGGRLRALLVPTGLGGAVLVGPLGEGEGAAGVLVMEIAGDPTAHLRVFQALLEPFTVALANDRRLHEALRLREAAEAQNRALLSRLQRQDVSNAIINTN
ncbi:MAG: hypothetical protein ACK4YP_13265, partial [Myxococcota bacterium]